MDNNFDDEKTIIDFEAADYFFPVAQFPEDTLSENAYTGFHVYTDTPATADAVPPDAEDAAEQPAEQPAEKRGFLAILLRILLIFVFVLVFIVGLVVMFYPDISNYINEKNQSRVVDSYVEAVNNYDPIDYAAYLEAARAYNARLAGGGAAISDAFAVANAAGDKSEDEYWDLLNFDNGVMGYVVIDSLDIELPIYHGTDAVALSLGAGHLHGSSLPVGGESVHTVISAHTGLPSARFFDRIDTLKQGDLFQVYVMKELLTYQVDQINVVLPHEADALAIQRGEDYATLVTCTPYGINSHRLLVRGERIETPPEQLPEIVAQQQAVAVEELTWLEKLQNSVVGILSAIVEFVAEVIVFVAQRVMDLIGIEY